MFGRESAPKMAASPRGSTWRAWELRATRALGLGSSQLAQRHFNPLAPGTADGACAPVSFRRGIASVDRMDASMSTACPSGFFGRGSRVTVFATLAGGPANFTVRPARAHHSARPVGFDTRSRWLRAWSGAQYSIGRPAAIAVPFRSPGDPLLAPHRRASAAPGRPSRMSKALAASGSQRARLGGCRVKSSRVWAEPERRSTKPP